MNNLRRAAVVRSASGEASVIVASSGFKKQAIHFAVSLVLTCAFLAVVSIHIGRPAGVYFAAVVLVAGTILFLLYARSPRSLREGAVVLAVRDGMVSNRWKEQVPLAKLRSVSVIRLKSWSEHVIREEFILLNDERGPVLVVDHRQLHNNSPQNDLPEMTCSATGLKYGKIRSDDAKQLEHLGLGRFRRLW